MNDLNHEVNTTEDFIEGQTIEKASESFHQEDFKYEAFISYRHVEPDQTIAAAIHKMVETFRVPKEFYVDGKRPTFRVFRDREELTTSNLSDSLDEALRSSKFLIVICSKRTPLSPWCVREVQEFKKLRGEEFIIPVLVEGEPADSFPPPIRDLKRIVTKEDGTTTEESHEILAAEMRPAEVQKPDFVGYESLEKENNPKLASLTKEALGLLKVEKYRIMAAILGCTYGDLKQRDKERRTKALLGISTIVAAALLFFGLFMIDAYRSENAAKREAVQSNSAILLDTARRNLLAGDRVKSVMISSVAMKDITPDMERYDELASQHMGILNDTVLISDAASSTVIDTDNSYAHFIGTQDDRAILSGLGTNQVGIWNAKNGELVQSLTGKATEQFTSVSLSQDGDYLATGNYDGTIRVWKTADLAIGKEGALVRTDESPEPFLTFSVDNVPLIVRYSYDGKYIYTILEGYLINTISIYDAMDGTLAGTPIEIPATKRRSISTYAFSPKAHQLGLTFETVERDASFVVYDLLTGKEVLSVPDEATPVTDSISGEENIYSTYRSIDFSRDGTEVYGQVEKKFIRFDLETGTKQMEYTLEGTGIATREVGHVYEMENEKDIYINHGYNIVKADKETGRIHFNLSLGRESIVKDYAVNENGVVVAIRADGTMGMAVGETVVSMNIDYGEGTPERLIFSKDGSRVFVLSKADRNIKIIDVSISENQEKLPGFLVYSTADKKHALIYNEGLLSIRNHETGAMSPISEDIFSAVGSLVPPEFKRTVALSNDLRNMAYINYTDKDGDGFGESSQLVSQDLKTGEYRWTQDKDFVNAKWLYTPDSKELLMVSMSGEATIRDTLTGELKRKSAVKRGFLETIRFSQDGTAVSVSFQEGSSVIYQYPGMNKIETVPGQVIYLDKDENGKYYAYSVYNNAGVQWKEGEEPVMIPFPDERQVMGTNEKDFNDYDPKSGYMLSIMNTPNADDTKNAFLIDFHAGQLLKSFLIDLVDYDTPSGILLDSGKQILLDDNYSMEIVNPDESDWQKKEYRTSTNSALITLLDYDALKQRAEEMVSGRQMTAEELREIGLGK